MKNLFIDIETTGLDPQNHGIIQLSGIIEIDKEVKDTFNYFIRPCSDDKIDDKALEFNNLTREELKQDSRFRDPLIVYKELITLLSGYVDKFDRKDKFHFIGYNSQAFDFPFVRAWFYKCKDTYFGSWFWSPSVDVMTIWAYLLTAKRAQLNNFQLATVAKFIGINIDDSKVHDSMYDIEITREMYHKIVV